jgi:hypothetical protein
MLWGIMSIAFLVLDKVVEINGDLLLVAGGTFQGVRIIRPPNAGNGSFEF